MAGAMLSRWLASGIDAARVTVIDPAMAWTIDAESFVSLSRNCPFDGWPVTSRATHVFVRGELLRARSPARQQ